MLDLRRQQLERYYGDRRQRGLQARAQMLSPGGMRGFASLLLASVGLDDMPVA